MNVNASVNAHANFPAPPPPLSVYDLARLCQEGKVNQAIELMDSGVKADADCFYILFEMCTKREDAKKAMEEGFLYFEEMSKEFGISPTLEHYLGVIDVLGKSAYLNEAVEYIEKLPFEPTVEIWEALRKYAQNHGDIDLEDQAEELIISLDPSKAVANRIPTPLIKLWY
ncbi:hypothetical protein NC653_001955 [Populus alba x Populus x berolinensis]|uniref:Pentatricopeptide repeat-containing protein n=1 Tax=Populus alba x Populus x berolinensis TaxID=444605 RepID=A0AAD6RMH0_9ROSI|nr:hypothetical protein NC653_001955 [Populus alba x Populus x berolinensis]